MNNSTSERRTEPNAANGGSPARWNLYFSCNEPRDIAKDFIEWDLTLYSDIIKFIDSSKAETKPDANKIYQHIRALQAERAENEHKKAN